VCRTRAGTKSTPRRNRCATWQGAGAKFGESRKAALVWKPQNTVAVNDEQGEKVLRLMGRYEHDDVKTSTPIRGLDALMQKLSA